MMRRITAFRPHVGKSTKKSFTTSPAATALRVITLGSGAFSRDPGPCVSHPPSRRSPAEFHRSARCARGAPSPATVAGPRPWRPQSSHARHVSNRFCTMTSIRSLECSYQFFARPVLTLSRKSRKIEPVAALDPRENHGRSPATRHNESHYDPAANLASGRQGPGTNRPGGVSRYSRTEPCCWRAEPGDEPCDAPSRGVGDSQTGKTSDSQPNQR